MRTIQEMAWQAEQIRNGQAADGYPVGSMVTLPFREAGTVLILRVLTPAARLGAVPLTNVDKTPQRIYGQTLELVATIPPNPPEFEADTIARMRGGQVLSARISSLRPIADGLLESAMRDISSEAGANN